jgi:hypothetical protein
MEVNYIVIVSFYCCNDSGVVGNGDVPPPLYDLMEHSHVLLDHTIMFHCKKNLGMFSLQMLIQVITYGCLEGLFEFVYTIVTKLSIYL